MAQPVQLGDLPFELDFRAGDDASSELTVTLTADPDPELEIDEDALTPSAEMVELLERAAEEQCFGSIGGGRCGIRLLEKRVSPDHRVWTYRFQTSNMPPGSYAILVGLLVQTVYAGDPLGRVSIQSSGNRNVRDAQWLVTNAQGIPAPPTHLPFPVEYGQPGRKERCVTLTFNAVPGEAAREEIEESLNVWDHLVTFGGFQLDFAEQDGFDPSMGSFDYPTANVLEHRIFFNGTRTAFQSLLHVALKIHTNGHTLASVVIE